jgi:hypothetical protein
MIEDALGRAVIEPPTRQALEAAQAWHHKNRHRMTLNRVLAIIGDPKSCAR